MLFISTPITEAPWYLSASGRLKTDSLPHLMAAIQAAQYGELFCPVLDLTQVEHVDGEAGERLADMVERGDVSLLGGAAAPPHPEMPVRLNTVLRESRLEAIEALLALIRKRRHDGLADSPAITALLERLRPSQP